MKKFLAIFLLLNLSITTMFAQRLGAVGGFQLTNTWPLVGGYAIDFNAKPGAGFHFGPLLEWDFSKHFGMDASILYGLKTMSFDMHYKENTIPVYMKRHLYTLDIPLHVYRYFSLKNGMVLTAFIGPSFEINLHGKDIAWESTELQKPVGLKTTDLIGKDYRIPRFQLSGELGLSLRQNNYQLRASYAVGFLNQTQKDFGWYFDLRTNQKKMLYDGVFKLSFAYLFDLNK